MMLSLILLPFVGAFVALFTGQAAKWVAFAVSGVTTILSLVLWLGYDLTRGGVQAFLTLPWISGVGLSFRLGLDGLSLPFVFLTALLTFVAILAEWEREGRGFFALFLLLQAAIVLVFTSLDLLLFFIAFELTLVPMFLIIGRYGYDGRRYAALKFLLYSLVGSVFLLVAILAVAFIAAQGGVLSFDYRVIAGQLSVVSGQEIPLLFCAIGFLVAFLIKLPAVPLHTWLPHAHTQAPTAGSILLAGVLLKLGGYGILRFNLGFFPQAMLWLQPALGAIAAAGILYGAYVALGQKDLKELIAYSSVSHMGFVLLGIASMTPFGLYGAVYGMLAHGVITGLLFMLVGMLSHRTHTRSIAAMRGMYTAMPVLGGLLWFALLGGAGIPGLAGFIGEVTSLVGAFSSPATLPFAAIGLFGIIANAGLMLWTVQRVLQGEPDETMTKDFDLHDLRVHEFAACAPLVFLAFLWGLYPNSLGLWINAGLEPLLANVARASRLVVFP